MKRGSRIKKRGKVRKPMIALSLAIGVIIVLSAVLYLGQLQKGIQKKPADEYFEIIEPTVDHGEPVENFTKWKVRAISFTLKAVGGDAHTVIVYFEGMADALELGDFSENESKWVPVEFSEPGYLIEINEDGKFPILMKIVSKEAAGYITILL